MPLVVGLSVTAGQRTAGAAGVVLAPADGDGPPLAALTWPQEAVITSQVPPPGETLFRWDSVIVTWDEPGGDTAGVREPRRPPPRPGKLTAQRVLGHEQDNIKR